MGDSFAQRWDPRDKKKVLDFEPIDLGWIGEDDDGVWIKVNPHTAFCEPEHERLWFQAHRFTCGLQEVTEKDWEELSAYEFEIKLTMAIAANGMLRRLMKGSDDDDPDRPGAGNV